MANALYLRGRRKAKGGRRKKLTGLFCLLLSSFLLLPSSFLQAAWITYPLNSAPIDVVIPCAPKDLETLDLCIQAIREHGENIGRILVISQERLHGTAEWFDERLFPFSKQQLAEEIFHGDTEAAQRFLNDPMSRIGWIYQQLLKLYAPLVIPNISPNVLILDADVIFFRPVSFMDRNGGPLFTFGFPYECVPAYIEHAKKLLPDFQRVHPHHSGIAHHMLFQKPIVENLLQDIANYHGIEAWRAICRCIDTREIFACLSEYELYFNYALRRTKQAKPRTLRHIDVGALHALSWYRRTGYDFAACHSWRRAP